MKKIETIALASIVVDKRYQTRETMDESAITDYADAIRQAGGWPFPPVTLVSQYVVDGFHRIAAAKRVIAETEIPVELRKSLHTIPIQRIPVEMASDDVRDIALLHALASNHTHGLRLNISDKRRAVKLALDRWPDESDREIAKRTFTSHTFVANMRRDLYSAAQTDDCEVATLPLYPVPHSPNSDEGEVATLPPEPMSRQDSQAMDNDPIRLAKLARNIAHQHRDKLARAIDDYARHVPNRSERDRLVRTVQAVQLWPIQSPPVVF